MTHSLFGSPPVSLYQSIEPDIVDEQPLAPVVNAPAKQRLRESPEFPEAEPTVAPPHADSSVDSAPLDVESPPSPLDEKRRSGP